MVAGCGSPTVSYTHLDVYKRQGPTDPSVLVVVPHWADAGVPRVVTLHDLIPLRDPGHYLPTPAHFDRYRTRAAWMASADLILTNSCLLYTSRCV